MIRIACTCNRGTEPCYLRLAKLTPPSDSVLMPRSHPVSLEYFRAAPSHAMDYTITAEVNGMKAFCSDPQGIHQLFCHDIVQSDIFSFEAVG